MQAFCCALALLLLSIEGFAQEDTAIQAMEWRAIGPFNGGRGTSVFGHPTDPMGFWFDRSSGGLWKPEDAETS